MDSKFYAASQAMDEARHVELYQWFIAKGRSRHRHQHGGELAGLAAGNWPGSRPELAGLAAGNWPGSRPYGSSPWLRSALQPC
jgi:hypothetical protein